MAAGRGMFMKSFPFYSLLK